MESAEEADAKEAIWRIFLASLDLLWLNLESPIWTAVAAVSDPHPERYAYSTTRSAWKVLDDTMTNINDAVRIHEWRVGARYATRRLRRAVRDLLRRINDTRVFYHMRDAHLAQRSPLSRLFDQRSDDERVLQRFTDALHAAPEALLVDPSIWRWSDFWGCFWLCASGQITLTDTDEDEDNAFVPDAVAYCALRALMPIARQLLQEPDEHALCEREIRNMMVDNADNAFTAYAPFQYALDQLGLRRLVETQLVHLELEHRHHRRRRNSNEEEKPLTLLNGNPYKFPRKSNAP